jgi:putative transposase
VISDNGPQFVARDLKAFIRMSGITHVRTPPCYPQINGKIVRWNASLKQECVRPGTPVCLEDGRRLVRRIVEHCNNLGLHKSIGRVVPRDEPAGLAETIFAQRHRRPAEARERRRVRRRRM